MALTQLLIDEQTNHIVITLNNANNKNSLNSTLLNEFQTCLDHCGKNPAIKYLVIKGIDGVFSTGMDFNEVMQASQSLTLNQNEMSKQYMHLLKTLSMSPFVTVAIVDGIALAGGVGIVCACDIAIATAKSQFTLTEAVWGLLPANLLPYLIRRVGFQKAYYMTITAQTITAEIAADMSLIDELSTEPDEALRKLNLRLMRLESETILDLKTFFRKLWLIDEKIEQLTTDELSRLLQQTRVKNNIMRYIKENKFPWEK